MSFVNEPLTVRWPDFEIPPVGWRARIADLNAEFASEGTLASEFREIRRIGQQSDLEAQDATRRLVARHADLFPGEAGWSLAWAIVCDAAPQIEVAAGPTQMRRPFDEPVPKYTARRRGAGRNRFQARTERNPEENRRLLALLRGEAGLPPQTFRRAAERLGLPIKAFHRRIETLKKLGAPMLDSESQKLGAAVFEPWRFRFKREGKIGHRSAGLSHHKAIPMTQDDATWRTGKALSDLIETYHCETFTQMRVGDPTSSEMIKVPPELILFPPRSAAQDESLT